MIEIEKIKKIAETEEEIACLEIIGICVQCAVEYDKCIKSNGTRPLSESFFKIRMESTLERAGYLVTKETKKYKLVIRKDWIFEFSFGTGMSTADLYESYVSAKNDFFNNTPDELKFENLTAEKMVYLLSAFEKRGEICHIPIWCLPIFPFGTKVYYTRTINYATNEFAVYEKILTDDIDFIEDARFGQLYYGIKF